MEKFKLTKKDKLFLKSIGYWDEDMPFIEKAKFVFEDYHSEGEISATKAIRMVGRKDIISGLGRATFHHSAVRGNNRVAVYIESDTFK